MSALLPGGSTTGARSYRLTIAAVCLSYLALEVLYVARVPLVMDEFQGANTVLDLMQRTPYRDYLPYKTVLGYYLQLPVALAGDMPWAPLFLVKLQMACINAGALAAGALILSRLFRRSAVVLGLVVTVLMSNFAERSSEFRVDMLTAWPGLFSLLALCHGRWIAGGVLAGVSFLISQKGIYFCAAGAAGVLAVGFSHVAGSRLYAPVRFAAGVCLSIAAYMLFWAIVASWGAVYEATFVRPQRVALESAYADIRVWYWMQTVARNPAFYGFACAGLIQLAAAWGEGNWRNRLLAAYGLVLLMLASFHRQPWPYFFVLIVPTLWVLVTAFFDRAIRAGRPGYGFGISPLVMALFLVPGVVLPLSRVPAYAARDNGYQQHIVETAHCLLSPAEQYIAGVDMVLGREQPVGMLRWIDYARSERIRRLGKPTLTAILDSLGSAPVKVVIENYRTAGLPPEIRNYLDNEYVHYWGNVSLYAPALEAGRREINLKFAGLYVLEAPPGITVIIDGRKLTAGMEVLHEHGVHQVSSPMRIRLRYVPKGCESERDPAYREQRDLFPNVYE